MMRIAVWCFLVVSAAADFEKDLADWFSNVSRGLGLYRWKADEISHREARYLAECGITIAKLQDLRNTLYDVVYLGDYNKAEKTAEAILPLAYKQVDASDLATLMKSMRLMWWRESNEDHMRGEVLEMVKHHVDLLQYEEVSRKIKDFRLGSVAIRTDLARDMVLAGVDVKLFGQPYYSPDVVKKAVDGYLNGRHRRYAKDCQLYYADQFQQYYPNAWLQEWLAAPEEMRTALDGKNYYAWEFAKYFGSNWMAQWGAAPTAVQYRISSGDRKEYSLAEFCSEYSAADWQKAWQAGGIKSLHGNTQNQPVMV